MNIRKDIFKTIKEGLPITLSTQAQQQRSGEMYVLVTDYASDTVKELAGDSRQAFIVSEDPLKISFPNSAEVIGVEPNEIVMEAADPKGGRPRGGPHIENLRFWDMSEMQLRYIVKDAGEAVKLNPTARKAGKWADEINDAVTVLYWRKKKNIKVEGVEPETVVQTKTVSGRKIQIKKIGSGPAHKVYVEEDPALEFPSVDAAKSWLTDYEQAGGHFTFESHKIRDYVKDYLLFINGGTRLDESQAVTEGFKKGAKIPKVLAAKSTIKMSNPKDPRWIFAIASRFGSKGVTSAATQDKVSMVVVDKAGKVIKDWGSHLNAKAALKFAQSKGYTKKIDESQAVTEAGAEETPYEKFFSSAMKKFGVASPTELSPDDTKKFFNYVDKNWDAEEESDGSQAITEVEDEGKRITALKKIAKTHTAGKVDGQIVDAYTAGGLVKLYDKLSEKNRPKFASLSLPKLVDFMWKQVQWKIK